MEEIFKREHTSNTVEVSKGQNQYPSHEERITELCNVLYNMIGDMDQEIELREDGLKQLRAERNVLIKNVTDIVNKANS